MEWMLGFAAVVPIGAVMFCCYMRKRGESTPLLWGGLSESERRRWEIEGCTQLEKAGPAATSITLWLVTRLDYLSSAENSMDADLFKCRTPNDVLKLREKYDHQLVDRIGNAYWWVSGGVNSA